MCVFAEPGERAAQSSSQKTVRRSFCNPGTFHFFPPKYSPINRAHRLFWLGPDAGSREVAQERRQHLPTQVQVKECGRGHHFFNLQTDELERRGSRPTIDCAFEI